MPPTYIGRGRVGSSTVSSPTRVAWEFDGQKFSLNGATLQLSEVDERGKRFEGLDDRPKRLFTKRSGDPRVAGTHQIIEMTFSTANHELVQFFEERRRFFRAPFIVRFYQYDYRDLGVGGSDKYDAARLYPSTPGAASCALWFFPDRGISNASGDGPTIYKNGAVMGSGITLDYVEGSVSFTTAPLSSDVIRAYYVWAPRILLHPSQTQCVPRPGYVRGKEVYDVKVVAEQY